MKIQAEINRAKIGAKNQVGIDRLVQQGEKYRAEDELNRTKIEARNQAEINGTRIDAMNRVEIDRLVQQGERYRAEDELKRTKTKIEAKYQAEFDSQIEIDDDCVTDLIRETEKYRAEDKLSRMKFEAKYTKAGDKDNLEASDKDKFEAGDKDKFEAGGKDKLEAGDKDKFEAGDKDKFEAGGKDKFEAGDKDKFEAGDELEAGDKAGGKDKFEAGDKAGEAKLKDKLKAGDKDKFEAGKKAGEKQYRLWKRGVLKPIEPESRGNEKIEDLFGSQGGEPLWDFYGRAVPGREPPLPPDPQVKTYLHPQKGRVLGQRYGNRIKILQYLDVSCDASTGSGCGGHLFADVPVAAKTSPGFFVMLARHQANMVMS